MRNGVVSMLVQWGRDLDLVLSAGAIERARDEAERSARLNEAKAALDGLLAAKDAEVEPVAP